MTDVFFTALVACAGPAAELAPGDAEPRVHRVPPTAKHEDDPVLADRKFPGDPTRSCRSTEPLLVVGEITDWTRPTPEAPRTWDE